MDRLNDHMVIVEEMVDRTDIVKILADLLAESHEAEFGFYSNVSRDASRAEAATGNAYLNGADRRLKVFLRQLRRYTRSLTRKSLFSFERRDPEEEVQNLKRAFAMAVGDMQLLQMAEIQGVETLANRIMERRLCLLRALRAFMENPGESSAERLKAALEASIDDWRSDGHAANG